MIMEKWVRPLSEIGRADVDIAGGKGANLGELIKAGMAVPPGFVITAPAYLWALEQAGVRDRLRDQSAAVAGADTSLAAGELRALVRRVPVPDELREAILTAYREMGNDIPVAVRSSATSEDSKDTSFAGMNSTFTNVSGDFELIDAVRVLGVAVRRSGGLVPAEPGHRCRAGAGRRRAADGRLGALGRDVHRRSSTADVSKVVIEAAFGLGEVVVGGSVEPDTYVLDKDGPRLRSVRVGNKDAAIVRGPDGKDPDRAAPSEAGRRVLTDDEVVELARTGLRIHEHYREPQDIEWAVSAGRWYILQSRPITTLGPRTWTRGATATAADAPGAPQRAVRIARNRRGRPCAHVARRTGAGSRRRGARGVMTSPDWVPIIKRAAALVTDGGGMTCHAAIVARELGVPCIVGTREATSVLHNGELVTVDATGGRVARGQRRPAADRRAVHRAAGRAVPRPSRWPRGST